MKAYLASHFFNTAGFNYTKHLGSILRKEFPDLDIYIPQENDDINDKEKNDDIITAKSIALADNSYLKDSNILIANIDGVEIDSGVSAEIGYFAALKEYEEKFKIEKRRYIIGLYTDMRQNGTGENRFYINLYTKGLIELHGKLVKNEQDLIKTISYIIKNKPKD